MAHRSNLYSKNIIPPKKAEQNVYYTGPLKSYFTMQYFKSVFTFLFYINGLCFTIPVIQFSNHFISINHINV